MSSTVSVRSAVGRLDRVAVRPPSQVGDYAGAHWIAPDLDLDLLETQHRDFVALLRSLGAGVEELPAVDDMPDGIFVYDPVFIAGDGAIVLRGAKAARVLENDRLAADLEAIGVPIIGRLTEPAYADGGDMLFLDSDTLAIGYTYRTNEAAAEQIRAIVEPQGINVVTFDMPHDLGPEYCLHLMSVISPVSEKLVVLYPKLAPTRLVQALESRGIGWVEVPDDEYLTLGCNVLAVAPGVAVLPAGNDVTGARLRDAGVDVHFYNASETNKGEGGPTCLTRPILRG